MYTRENPRKKLTVKPCPRRSTRGLAVIAAALLLQGAASSALAQARRAPARPSPASPTAVRPTLGTDRAVLRKRGQAIVDDWISTSGRFRDSVWTPRIDSMVRRLTIATGVPALEPTWVLLNDASVNAAALPGGFVVVFRGMLDFVDSAAARTSPPAERSLRATGMLASVIAHELAHVTLGHVETPSGTGARAASGATPNSRPSGYAMRGVSDGVLTQARQSRDDESAADRTGALYLLRAGYEIEGALAVMRAMDAAERAKPLRAAGLDAFTWLRGHPRAAARLAALESYRATIRAHQVALDDALTLLASDAEPATAVALLDDVLADFPDLAAARHARAAARQQQYASLVPVSTLKLHPSTPVFSSEFLLSVRGETRTASALMTSARADYERAMAVDVHPYTLSALAVLDAWAGQLPVAMERAERARREADDDVDVLNNLAVVQYLAGIRTAARATLERAVRLGGDSLPPRVLFNYARVLIELGDAEGRRIMAEYLVRDGSSAWASAGRALSGPDASVPDSTSTHLGVVRDTVTPSVHGVRLGALPAEVVARLGEAEAPEQQREQVLWHYPARGMTVVLSARDGVTGIVLAGPAADSSALAGVYIGQPISRLRATLGAASDVQRDRFIFLRGSWMLVVDRTFGLVSRIAVQPQ
ncbi:MAG: M48 family metallopeptidase [Gemmatimonadaceae bacterium]|nr:M48 family metallopeptidase [Gemmatimonadaceae bacterium]